MPGVWSSPQISPVPLYLGAKLSANVDHAAAGGDDGRVLTGIFEAFVTDGTDARLSQIIPARPHKVADDIGEFFHQLPVMIQVLGQVSDPTMTRSGWSVPSFSYRDAA